MYASLISSLVSSGLTVLRILWNPWNVSGTFDIAEKFAESKCLVCLHKHYSAEQGHTWSQTERGAAALPYTAVSAGTSKVDFDRTVETLKLVPGIRMICLDVANGYSEFFVEAVQRVRP